MECYKGWKKTS